MNVLVIGGNGFIGSHLVDVLLSHGHKIRVFDFAPEKFRDPLPGVDYRISNLNNISDLAEALEGIDTVFHLASSSVPSTSVLDLCADVNNNLIPMLRLLDLMVKMNVKKIVYFSSGGAVYGEPSVFPTVEEHQLNPISSYGIVKATIEHYIKYYERVHALKHLIIRPSNPYGPRQGHFKAQGVIATFLQNILKNDDLVVFGDGNATKDYIYITDLVEACYSLFSVNAEGLFNVGSGMGLTINEIVSIIEKVTDTPLKIKYINSKINDVQKVVLDINKLNNVTGWTTQIPIELGIKKYWKWLNENR
jgi:UDP-glucose 4-epimerase